MDLVSHAVIGAASAMLVSRPHEVRYAALAGAAAGLLPDADALIRSADDALLYFEYHRHFSHSLVFIPIGALIVAAILWPLLRKSLVFARLYLFCCLGLAFAGVIDACTSYGTHLLWPFVDARIAWNLISILDPLFTLLVGIPVIVALRRSRPMLASVGLALGAFYLGLGWMQHERAMRMTEQYAAQHSIEAERVLVKPTFGNLVLWRGIVQTREHIHVAGVRPSILGEPRMYPGESAKRFTTDHYTALPNDSRLRSDLGRFAFFADELLSPSTVAANLIGDARYSMRPDSLRPIWSVRFDINEPDQRVAVMTDREMSAADRTRFLEMLMGQP